ncbi:MAG: AsmA-like C-terminal region-containing protein, partial [Planctomycetota bacterium]
IPVVPDAGIYFTEGVDGDFRLTDSTDTDLPWNLTGSLSTPAVSVANYRFRPGKFSILSDGNVVKIESDADRSVDGFHALAQIPLAGSSDLIFETDFDSFQLETLFDRASVVESDDSRITSLGGLATGQIGLRYRFPEQSWSTDGKIKVKQMMANDVLLDDVDVAWQHDDEDWKKSRLESKFLGGGIQLSKITRSPFSSTFTLENLKINQLSKFGLETANTSGLISGTIQVSEKKIRQDATENDPESRQDEDDNYIVNVDLDGSDIVIGGTPIGLANGKFELDGDQLNFSAESVVAGGKAVAQGVIDLASTQTTGFGLVAVEDPSGQPGEIEVTLENASIAAAVSQFKIPTAGHKYDGEFSAKLFCNLDPEYHFRTRGSIDIRDARIDDEILSKHITSRVLVKNKIVLFDQIKVDLSRGFISGFARFPINLSQPGIYQLDVKQFDLSRLAEVITSERQSGVGYINGRISGALGNQVSGEANFRLSQSRFLGQTSSLLRLPVRFSFRPASGKGRIEFPRSRQQIFGGTVVSEAEFRLGTSMGLNSKINFSAVDTDKLARGFGVTQMGQGDLSGTLALTGKSIRSPRDLAGRFQGKLSRAAAFELPILEQITQFANGVALQGQDFESDRIDLLLKRGQIEVSQFNIGSSLASLSVSGNANLDGRLDLQLAARLERFNQPVLIDQILGSPLANYSGSSTLFFARAADFLSDRLLFFNVGGTINRPHLRPDTGRQLREEAIRYFLRNSQILPNPDK